MSYLLFFSKSFGRGNISEIPRYNLTLFKEIRRFWHYRAAFGTGAFLINTAGNVISFMPFGILLPAVSRFFKNGFTVIISGFAFSLLAEVIQLETGTGSFDVDDLFLNTLGVLTGYLLGLIYRWIRGKYYEKKKI